jgi:hypothetical protein
MTKGIITRIWLWGIIGMAVGLLIAGVATGLMLAYGGTFVRAPSGNGYDFVPTVDANFWTALVFICLGGLLLVAGVVVQFVAWIGALVNSYQLQDKMWFLLTLLLGLIGLQLIVMIVYVIAGPEGYPEKANSGPQASAPAPFPRTA